MKSLGELSSAKIAFKEAQDDAEFATLMYYQEDDAVNDISTGAKDADRNGMAWEVSEASSPTN